MALIHFTSNPADIPADGKITGIICPVARGHYGDSKIGPDRMITYSTHHGLCIKEREVNGYHDSDFYMTVWDEEKQEPKSICFATTRGWSYPCYASYVDATPEVLEKYKAWQDRKAREYRAAARRTEAEKRRIFRNTLRKIAKNHEVPYPRLLTLTKNVGLNDMNRLIPLFGLKVRSGFKVSLRGQVIEWLKDPNPKYKKPLSPKQWSFL